MAAPLPKLGKLPPKVFDEVIFPRLGARDSTVVVPPRHGVDFGVVDLGDRVLIVTCDPVFIVPEYGWERSAWFAVHILASDVAVSGNAPRYLAIDLNLPTSMKGEEFRAMWTGIHEECRRLGIAVVTGHTGVYAGTDYPMVGGAAMFTVAPRDGYVTSGTARPGDLVLMTKGPAIETAGILATMFPQVLEERYGRGFAEAAGQLFFQQSVVRDALALARLGVRTGVTAMHDATEYGVWGALHDIAEASRVGIEVYRERLFVREDVERVLSAFSQLTGVEADPFAAISEGTLIATVKPERGGDALRLLADQGVDGAIIGRVTDEEGRVTIVSGGGQERLDRPREDPFWPMFFKTLEILGAPKR